jgi:peptidoglycan/xylan/chitin deacetylase (PgdA/CDA1 family)
VALHGYRHRNLLRLTPGAFERDVDRGAEVVESATGARPLVYRPPYGIFSPPGLSIARRHGFELLLWSRWGHDWRGSRAPEQIASEVTRELGPGDVLLLHDADHYNAAGSWRNTLAAMPLVFDELARLGMPAVTPAPTIAQPAGSL